MTDYSINDDLANTMTAQLYTIVYDMLGVGIQPSAIKYALNLAKRRVYSTLTKEVNRPNSTLLLDKARLWSRQKHIAEARKSIDASEL